MENQKTSLIYGAYGAFLGIVFYFMLLLSGNSPWSPSSWMGAWIPGVTAYYVLKLYKEEHPDITISFYQVFKKSMQVIFFQALFFTTISVLFSVVIDTGAVEMYKAEMLANEESVKTMKNSVIVTLRIVTNLY